MVVVVVVVVVAVVDPATVDDVVEPESVVGVVDDWALVAVTLEVVTEPEAAVDVVNEADEEEPENTEDVEVVVLARVVVDPSPRSSPCSLTSGWGGTKRSIGGPSFPVSGEGEKMADTSTGSAAVFGVSIMSPTTEARRTVRVKPTAGANQRR